MSLKNRNQTAFTMIELLLVIIVLGILTSLAIPRMDRDRSQEAADNILSSIRYTQHLALTDNKTDPFDTNWQQKFWMIRFVMDSTGENSFYTVSSDTDKSGTIHKAETAIDPSNGKYMYNTTGATVTMDSDESPNIFIGNNYGINAINLNNSGCTTQHIAFDNLGRPHTGLKTTATGTLAGNNYATYMSNDCNMTFSFIDSSTDSFNIIIKKETGYAYIDGQPDS